jgi:hypothetical protein
MDCREFDPLGAHALRDRANGAQVRQGPHGAVRFTKRPLIMMRESMDHDSL